MTPTTTDTLDQRRVALEEELAAAGRRFIHARAEEALARQALKPLIVACRKAGTRQSEVVDLSGLTRVAVANIETDWWDRVPDPE